MEQDDCTWIFPNLAWLMVDDGSSVALVSDVAIFQTSLEPSPLDYLATTVFGRIDLTRNSGSLSSP